MATKASQVVNLGVKVMIKERDKRKKKSSRVSKVTLAILLSLIVIVGGTYILEYIGYYTKWHECGHEPLMISRTSGGGLGWGPQQQYYAIYVHTEQMDKGTSALFCTVDEAKASMKDSQYVSFSVIQ